MFTLRTLAATVALTLAPAALADTPVATEDSTKISAAPPPDAAILKRNMHGFRAGYMYAPNAPDYSDRVKSPHMFVIGYEFTQRLTGGDWLNVITVENVMISGLNQSLIVPTANALVGFEVNQAFQVGVGANLNPFDPNGKMAHMMIAGGATPRAGAFSVPIHLFYVPDVDGDYRFGVTTGVNW